MTPAESPGARELAAAVQRLQDELTRLRSVLAARPLLDIATGMLAERLGCPPADAAAQLLTLAGQAHVGAAEFATEIVGESAETRVPAGPGPPGFRPESTAAQLSNDAQPMNDAQTAADAVLDQAGNLFGATGVLIWAVEPGGGLALAGAAGFSAAQRSAWRHIPPGVPTPAQHVARSGEEFGPRDSSDPSLGQADAPWRAALPIRRRARLLGVLELAWPDRPAELPGSARRQLRALAEICALSLPDLPGRETEGTSPSPVSVLDAVLDPAVLLEPLLGSEDVVADFRILRVNSRFLDPVGRPAHSLEGRTLIEAYPLACADGLLERLRRVHSTGEAIRGEKLRLTFLVGDLPQPTALEIAAARFDSKLILCWRSEESDAWQAMLLENAQRLARLGGFEEDLVTGTIRWNARLRELHGLPADAAPTPFAALPAHVHPDDEQAVRRLVRSVLRQRKEASAAFRLIRPSGLTPRYIRVVAEPVIDTNGRLVAVRGAYQDVSAHHWTEIALAATRERLADTEQQAAERHRLALRLQQAIMPPEPPPLDVAGLSVAVRYRPAAQEERVGGDWYDAVLLPDRTALLVVGDMAGHGVEAATGMVSLRNALRGLAVTGAGPARLLAWLNLAAGELTDPATATAICARYDPDSRELCWARAGHLPPLLVRAGQARLLPMPHGVLIGADPDSHYEEDSLRLEPGDVLLLYTDGLIERRDRSVEDSLHQLVDDLGQPSEDLDRFLDHLLDRSTADTDDDTCLIAVRVADN
ncbi:SpoIIE family protein phosphatase [Kitasatospora sp. GP82]|uniref:SpoIIE family protein phosphatase n=1 Tax=Kitasatospora sp. GP82 TaxID=3035089 RepID=UPI002474CEEA|nr:SpoIIE family protein phosphatase [Kitasatospora sp. GP82]MDH6127354.1 serine phosphatase RsbU (regulator of sigma subunit) [Kitasatospora sp. GP82]